MLEIYSAYLKVYIFIKIWFPYFFYSYTLYGCIFTKALISNFELYTVELNIFYTDLHLGEIFTVFTYFDVAFSSFF